MIIKIKIDKESTITFDTDDLPLEADFDALKHLIGESSLSTSSLYKIAYAYKNKYEYCKQILDMIRSCTPTKEMFIMALDMTHNMPVCIQAEYKYKSYYILMGYNSIKSKMYKQALSYFSKAQHKLGIELCNYYMNNDYNYTYEVLKALYIFNNKDMKNYEVAIHMLKRNIDEKYFDEVCSKIKERKLAHHDVSTFNNIDVTLRYINENIDTINMCDYNISDNEYFLYLQGKKEHLNKNYTQAIEFYKKSLSVKHNIYAKYNMCRILQNDCLYGDSCMSEDYDCYSYNNFKYYMYYLKKKPIDVKHEIDEDIKNFIIINSGIKTSTESYISKYNMLLHNKYVDKNIIINNIVYYKYKNIDYNKLKISYEDIRMLKDVYYGVANDGNPDRRDNESQACKRFKESVLDIEDDLGDTSVHGIKNAADATGSDTYDYTGCGHKYDTVEIKPYIRYNLYYLTKDTTYYDKENEYSKMLYNYNTNNVLESCGIYDKLKRAQSTESINLYADCLSSVYGATGVGICLAKKQKYKEALQVFSCVLPEYKDVHMNIGNVYVLQKEYEKALHEYLQTDNEYARRRIGMLYEHTTDINILVRIYNKYINGTERNEESISLENVEKHEMVNGEKGYTASNTMESKPTKDNDVSIGIEGLKRYIYKLMIEQNKLENINEYQVEDKELQEMYTIQLQRNKEADDKYKKKAYEVHKFVNDRK